LYRIEEKDRELRIREVGDGFNAHSSPSYPTVGPSYSTARVLTVSAASPFSETYASAGYCAPAGRDVAIAAIAVIEEPIDLSNLLLYYTAIEI
jgi:hypothetical protein